MNAIKKILPLFCIIVLAIGMFWDKGEGLFTPNTFHLWGDASFPLNINYINIFSYAWDLRGNFGLGQNSISAFQLPIYFFVWLWSYLNLPLWIANRLWHVLPNIFIGLGAFYLYRSFFRSKYSWICGTIAAVFIMLLPERNVFAHGGIGFAATLFILGAFIRGLFSESTGSSKKYSAYSAAIFSLGILIATIYPRCLYITLIIIGLIMLIGVYYYRRRKRQSCIPIIKFIGSCAVLTLLFNLFWIIPLTLQWIQGLESLWADTKILEARTTFQLVHQQMTNPLYLLRATTGGAGIGRPSYYFFSHPLILPFTFLVPIFCFLPLLLRNVDKKIRILALFCILLSLYPASFHFLPAFNMFLRNHIPTFWIMNDPTYWLLYVGSCYGLIIGSMTEYFLILFADKKAQKIIFITCVTIVVIIFGGPLLFDRALIPGSVHVYTLMGTKFPYVKVPDEYDELEKYLDENAGNTDRVWYISTGGFKRYKWAYNGHMPEFLFFKSPITTVGRGMSYATPIIDLLSDSVNSKRYTVEESRNLILFMQKIMNVRYIFIHKDLFDGKDSNGRDVEGIGWDQREIDLNNYVREEIVEHNNFNTAMDTESFILYENKDFSPGLIYCAADAALVKGDLDLFSLIAQNRAYTEKPIFIFTEQAQNEKLEIQKMGIDNIVFRENNKQDLPIESYQKTKVILINRGDRQKEKEDKLICQNMDQKEIEVLYIANQDKEFSVSQEGEYVIKAKVKVSVPTVERHVDVKDEIGPEFRFGTEEELKDWSFCPVEVTYDDEVTKEDVLLISLYFDGDEKEDEYIQMQNRNVKIDLKNKPYFSLKYKIENSEVQTIELVAGIDFDNDGIVNEYFRAICPSPSLRIWDSFNFNLYKLARDKFPYKKHYDLIFIELYPHKLWGADCSSPARRGEYRFWIKDLEFYNISLKEFFEVIENTLNIKMDSAEEIRKWAVESKDEEYILEPADVTLSVTKHMPYLVLSRYIDKIDLRRFHMIELEYLAGDSKFQNVELVLTIDFNGDGVADEEVTAGRLPLSEVLNKFQVDAYKAVKDKFPDENKYYLIQIKLRLSGLEQKDKSVQETQLFYIRGLKIYSYNLFSSLNLHRPIIELDGQKYWFSKKIKRVEDTKNLLFEQTVHLKKGKHYLERLTDEGLDVKWVVLEPKAKIQKVETIEPEIIFKKINPAKYEVQVFNAKEPFWLVFSESFHKQWKVYFRQKPRRKEAKSTMRFTPEDIKYLFKKPLDLDAEHHIVNGYANGWYIDPEKLNLDSDFTLYIYFWPQSLFYIGLGVSGLTFLSFIGFIGVGIVKNRKKKGFLKLC